MIVSPLVIHERKGVWGRQLRPRVATWNVRPVETRSESDLVEAAHLHPFPVAVFDLGEKPPAMLADLDAFLECAPGALTVALDPGKIPEVAALAWELGATLVLSGLTRPPDLVDLLARWVVLSRTRAEADGWFPADKIDEDDPYLGFASPSPLVSSIRH